MALMRRFSQAPDATENYQPGAVKPGLVRRGGVTGTMEPGREVGALIEPPVPAPNSTPESGPYTPVTPDRSSWNTDGYQAPTYTPQNVGAAPAGFDPGKWADVNHQTPKYGVSRIWSQYPQTPEGLQQALPEIQRAYPGVQIVGRDKLDIPGVGVIDVGRSFASGGNNGGPQWLPVDGAEVRPYTPTALPTQAQEPPTERNAILEMLEADGRKPLRTAQYRVGREV